MKLVDIVQKILDITLFSQLKSILSKPGARKSFTILKTLISTIISTSKALKSLPYGAVKFTSKFYLTFFILF